jgi:hypothetical protein
MPIEPDAQQLAEIAGLAGGDADGPVAAFVALATDPELLAARAHRVAGLERAALIGCESGAEPVLVGA